MYRGPHRQPPVAAPRGQRTESRLQWGKAQEHGAVRSARLGTVGCTGIATWRERLSEKHCIKFHYCENLFWDKNLIRQVVSEHKHSPLPAQQRCQIPNCATSPLPNFIPFNLSAITIIKQGTNKPRVDAVTQLKEILQHIIVYNKKGSSKLGVCE